MQAHNPSWYRTIAARHAGVAAIYLFLALLLWWPLPAHLTTHVPGSNTWAFDEYTFVWNLWWFRHALLDLGVNPLHSDHLFYPLGIDLVLYTYNILNAALALPLLDWLGPVLSSNLLLIGMSVLSGWGTWLLCRWLLWRTLGVRGALPSLAAWGAGALYAFGAYRSVYAALGHYDLVSTGFIPLFILFFLKAFWGGARAIPAARRQDSALRRALLTRALSPRPAVLAGVWMAAALANEMIFGVFLAMLALLLMLFTWRRAAPGWLPRLVVAVIVAALLWSPVGVPVVRTLLSTDYVLAGWGDALKLSADLLSFTSPTALHPLWGPGWVEELRAVQVNAVSPGASRFSDVNTVFVGVVTLLLCVVALARYRRIVLAWGVALLTFLVLSLGPVLQVGGRYLWSFDNVLPGGQLTAIPLPFILLHYLPIVQGNRAANRFGVVLLLCAAVLVAYALDGLGRAGERGIQGSGARAGQGRRLSLLLPLGMTALVLIEHLSFPLPLTDARIPAGYRVIAEDPDDVALLTLPLGWRNSFGVIGAENTRNQYYMVAHGKRLVQGNISRAPAEKFEYWQKLPVLRSLIEIQNDREAPAEQVAEDARRAVETLHLLGVRYVVVHPAVAGRPPYEDNRERALAYLQEVLPLEQIYEGDDLLVYRLDAPPPAAGAIEFGAPESDIYRVEGWSANESEGDVRYNWAMGEATFLLPVGEQGQPRALILELRPFQLPQEVSVLVNGRTVGAPQALSAGWNELRLEVPAALLDGPTAQIEVRFSRADRPVEVLPGVASLGGTGVETRSAITVKSAAAGLSAIDPAGVAWITVGGEDASEHRLGVNVTVLDPVTGSVEAVEGFDTTANEFEREQLHAFLDAIPQGKIVIVALKGAATTHLNQETMDRLQGLGATSGPTQPDVSYALIGVKGAVAGSALEAESATGEVDLAHLPDDRPLSSAVRSARWE